MSRLYVSAFVASCLLLPASALAQEAAVLPQALVRGLAVTDLLNVRADPSPIGRTLGRLPNGAFVERHECRLVEGYEWCHVGAPEFDGLTGWAPARYLYPLEIDGAETIAEQPEETASKEARVVPEAGDAAVPEGLEARFAEGTSRPIEEIMAREGDRAAAANPGIPTPTPRPGRNDGPPGEIASAQSAQPLETLPTGALPSGPMTDEIPCARYIGQPMVRCTAHVRRSGADSADVTIAWPDGGNRVIEFRDGLPAGSNSGDEFRFTREGTLNMIRIGVSERFEILDALPFDG